MPGLCDDTVHTFKMTFMTHKDGKLSVSILFMPMKLHGAFRNCSTKKIELRE